MRTGGVVVGRGDAGCSNIVAQLNQLEHIVHVVHSSLAQTHNLHLALGILQHSELLLSVEKIKYFAGVDLEEACAHILILALHSTETQLDENVTSCQSVDALGGVLSFAVEITTHGVCFSTACLTISETSGHSALEDGLD